MKKRRVFAVLVAAVLIPFALSWGLFLLIPAALLLVPCLLLAAIAAVPALLVWLARSPDPRAHRPQEPAPRKPVFST